MVVRFYVSVVFYKFAHLRAYDMAGGEDAFVGIAPRFCYSAS